MYASGQGNLGIVRLLLEKGAKINERDNIGLLFGKLVIIYLQCKIIILCHIVLKYRVFII